MAYVDSDVDFMPYGGLITIGTYNNYADNTLSVLNLNALQTRTGGNLVLNDANNDGSINIGETFTVSHPGGGLSPAVSHQLTLVGTGYHGTLLSGRVVLVGVDSNGGYWLVFPNGDAPDITGIVVSTLSVASVGYNPVNDAPICFGTGTLIITEMGLVAVEDLRIGDLVMTRDDGLMPVRWIGRRQLSAANLVMHPEFRPIRIMAGALGHGLPERDMLLSPQHRVLVRSRIAERMFGEAEVLVAACHLTSLPGVDVAADVAGIGYFHLMFDSHQVIYAEGAPAESLYCGPMALKSLASESREEIFALFPELRDAPEPPASARQLVKGREGRKLAERHLRNERLLLQF